MCMLSRELRVSMYKIRFITLVQLNIIAAFYIVDFHVTPERPLMIVLVQYANGGKSWCIISQ